MMVQRTRASMRAGCRSTLLALACAVGMLLLAACATPATTTPTATTTAGRTVAAFPLVELQRTIDGPALFAFLPPQAREAAVEGAGEAQAHVRFAVADTRRCLGNKPVRIETVFADRLRVRDGSRSSVFTPDAMGLGIGAVLIEPGRAGIMVQSTVGASSLKYQLPQAAFDYWRVSACKRD